MSLERKHVVLSGFVALIVWGLAVRHFPVLRYLVYSFVLGAWVSFFIFVCIIFAASKGGSKEPQVLGCQRPLLVTPRAWKADTERYRSSLSYTPSQLYANSFVVSAAIENLLGLALRDFVSSWYNNISPSPAFVNEVDKNIRTALVGMRDRLLREDIVNIIVSRVVPIITVHLHDFDQAERAVRGRTFNHNITESEELDLKIAAKYKDGQIHPAASLSFSDTRSLQQDHLRKFVLGILPDLLPEEMMRSRAVSVLIKEIVACAVFYPILQTLSEPDTWNQLIEAYGRTTLQDRKNVRRMRAALDEHTSPVVKQQAPLEIPRLGPNDSERAFERFVRAIRKTKTLADARRFRSQIASQLAKESAVEGQDPVYIRRLEMGKRVLDQKIAKMVPNEIGGMANQAQAEASDIVYTKPRDLALAEIMHTSSGLSYFMEYMDRINKMSLVQFWIVVDGFRNPLEDDFGEDRLGTTPTWTDTDRLDISQIFETYVSRPEMNVPQESQDAIRAFLIAGRQAAPEQYQKARMAILSAQSVVLEELERKHFPHFRKTDLYFKFLASDDGASTLRLRLPAPDTARPSSPRPSKSAVLTTPTSRTSSQSAISRGKDLRRAALSSSDVNSLAMAKPSDGKEPSRRSFDADYKPLFDDDYDTDPLAHSTQSLGPESANGDSNDPVDVIENMEAALTKIMTSSKDPEFEEGVADASGVFPPPDRRSIKSTDRSQATPDSLRMDAGLTDKPRPSLATLGLVNTSSRIGVFTDNDLFPDEERFIEDEYLDRAEEDDDRQSAGEDIHEAAPGDLGLAEAIAALSTDIERLVSQESVVNTLTRKAELTNNVAELRILSKSKASLQREIRRKELQRQQYIVQESDNSLYGKSNVSIKSVMVGRENDGKEFALYVIEVRRQAGEQMVAATWSITRRYSEFHDLHGKLRRRYPSTRSLEFPRRRMVMKLQKQFLHNRRVALEAYLQQLLRMPDVCRSRELRSFLSQQAISTRNSSGEASDTQDIVSRIYNSVTDGMDEFIGNIAVLDQLSTAGQNLITAASTQMANNPNSPSDIVRIPAAGSVAEAEAELRAFEDKELEPFVKPICDIFLEIFELNRGNNWLRGRAVVVVLHQLLGGTVERKVRDSFKASLQEDSLLRYIDLAKETMWPGGGKMRASVTRTASEKAKSKATAIATLQALIPDLAGSVVGRANAQAAARRIYATMNNARLNQHLALSIFDEIMGVLFDIPGLKKGH